MEAGIEGADVVYLLRIQLERQSSRLFGSSGEYHRLFGLTSARLSSINPGAIVMHPGPSNHGVEASGELLASGRSLVREQVANGVVARMSALLWLCGRAVS